MINKGRLDASLQTDRGQVHDHNEDFVFSREPGNEEDENKNGWIFTVADGVGGADAGEVASEYSTERVYHHYLKSQQIDAGERMQTAFHAANKDLRAFAAKREHGSRMATTMVSAVITDDIVTFTNVGDSRGYLLHNGQIRQITKDHSLVAKLLEEGVLTPEQAENYPRSNVILYSLGSEHEPLIETFAEQLLAGDVVMVCSDGLTRHVPDEEIAGILQNQPASASAKELVQLANSRGGHDNISVGVIRFRPTETTSSLNGSVSRSKRKGAKLFLWLFTALLSVLQSAGIFIIWLYLFK